MDFANVLIYKIQKLASKYGQSSRKVATHLIWWTLPLLLQESKEPHALIRSTKAARADGRLRFLFVVGGGLGDVVAFGFYLKALRRYLDDERVLFGVAGNFDAAALSAIFRGFSFVETFGREKNDFAKERFDAVFDATRLPCLLTCNFKTAAFFSKRALEYVERLKANEAARPALFRNFSGDYARVAFALANGRSMRTQYDFDGALGMTEAERSLAVLDESAAEALSRNGLTPGAYITLQRGVGGKSTKPNVRNWPSRYYRALVEKLRAEFPELKTVALGRRSQQNEDADAFGVDVDLRDATSFEELKFLLKNSALHIDGECGMVHVAHTLGVRSAVFWGQTQPAYCGYSENINVFAPDGCPFPCGFSLNDWQTNCARGFEVPPCMTKLTPEIFFDAIRPTLREIVDRPRFEWERVAEAEENAARQDVAEGTNGTGERETVLFVGDFDVATVAAQTPGADVVWFSLNATLKQLADAKAAGVDADWADATNVPTPSAAFDRVFCDVEEPSEAVRREILRIAKTGGTARFGKNGGLWRKRVVESGDGKREV